MADPALVDRAMETGIPADALGAGRLVEETHVEDAEIEEQKPAKTPASQRKPTDALDDLLDEDEGEGDDEAGDGDEEAAGDEEEGGEDGEDEEGEGGEEADELDPDIEVVVDGETKVVKFSALKDSYSLAGATEKRLHQATELRNGYQKIGEQLFNNLEAQHKRLQAIDAVLKDIAEPKIDWDTLRTKEPGRYLIERDKAREAQEKRDKIATESQRVRGEQEQLQGLERQVRVQAETGKFLEKMPELRDPEKAAEHSQMMMKGAGTYYGIPPQEVAAIADHRHLLVLTDALKYRALLARKAAKGGATGIPGVKGGKLPGAVKKAPALAPGAVKPLLRPGASGALTKRLTEGRTAKANLARARETGSIEDVARLLIVRRPK